MGSANAQVLTEDYVIAGPTTGPSIVQWTESLGRAVCADSGLVAISADNDSRLGVRSGGVVYVLDAESGQHLYRLSQMDAEETDAFGYALDMGDGYLIVGSPGDSDDAFQSGSAYLYHALSGAFLRKYTPYDGALGSRFGTSVAIDDGVVAIGSYFDNEILQGSGAVYLYEMLSGNLIAKLKAEVPVASAHFGVSVALSGSTLVVGSFRDLNSEGVPCGAVYVYDLNTLENSIKITPFDGAEGDFFGLGVATNGSVVLVGSPRDDTLGMDSGSIYIYNAATGDLIAKRKANESAINGSLGIDVSIDGNVAIVGGYAYHGVNQSSGAAFLFDTRDWTQIAKLQASTAPVDIYEFGFSVALTDGRAIVGAPRVYANSGEVSHIGMGYAFTLPDPSCISDVNGDGEVTPADFTAWIAAFNTAAPGCDQNSDGSCDPADFTAWIANFNAGC